VLDLLDQSLEAFLREVVPLPKRQIDLSFDAPDSDWGAKVTKPTVNLFLWDLRRNFEERQSGMQITEDGNGRRIRAFPKPRVNCRYLVTAWTADVRDEHQLLGSVLAALIQHQEMPAEHLQGAFAPVRPLPTLSVAGPDGSDNSDFWSALGGQLKPGLDLVVTATVDLVQGHEPGPLVERYDLGLTDPFDPRRTSGRTAVGGRTDDSRAGATLTTKRGRTRVRPDGTFLVPAAEGDEVTVDADPPVRATVPGKGQVSFAEGKPKAPRR
jgi:hypothetical protein